MFRRELALTGSTRPNSITSKKAVMFRRELALQDLLDQTASHRRRL
jgi:hypothetical protein